MRACRSSEEAQRLRLASAINGSPSSLAFSHPGEGFLAPRWIRLAHPCVSVMNTFCAITHLLSTFRNESRSVK